MAESSAPRPTVVPDPVATPRDTTPRDTTPTGTTTPGDAATPRNADAPPTGTPGDTAAPPVAQGVGAGSPRATNAGPGRLLIFVYALFAVAAGARAGVQIATRFDEAPLAYCLSAVAAVIYLVAAVGLARDGRWGRRLALVCCTVELTGVLAVGGASLAWPDAFPDATVWSLFGNGYGFIPLVLPILGLTWLRRTTARPSRP